MKTRLITLSLLAIMALSSCGDNKKTPQGSTDNPQIPGNSDSDLLSNTTRNEWFVQAAATVEDAQQYAETRGAAKNVILFVGDGMGISTVTAARILEGQQRGEPGEENVLSFEQMPFTALSKTYNVDAQTPDSAGTMTALMSGVKTDAGVIGVSEGIVRGDCSTVAGNELVTALELAEMAGMSTGIVSTTRITHATPASTYAKSADRDWEDISDMPEEAIAAGCEDIASQLVNFEARLESRYEGLDVDGLEVAFGGGRRHFMPDVAGFNSSDASSDIEGDRTDARDLTLEWKQLYTDGSYIIDQAGFDALDPEVTSHVMGLFNESHMHYAADRSNDIAGEPSLTEMTEKAIAVLDNNQKGYFLSVESGRIDHAHHVGNAAGALTDTIELSNAVKAAMNATDPAQTLIIVTADHSHVFTMAGYPKRGNPILGKVISIGSDKPSLASDDLPYTTLGYTNGLGFRNLGAQTNADAGYVVDPANGRQDLTQVETATQGFHQEALIPLSAETHGGEDVGIYSQGPAASLLTGTLEQNQVFHTIEFAADLIGKANLVLSTGN